MIARGTAKTLSLYILPSYSCSPTLSVLLAVLLKDEGPLEQSAFLFFSFFLSQLTVKPQPSVEVILNLLIWVFLISAFHQLIQ